MRSTQQDVGSLPMAHSSALAVVRVQPLPVVTVFLVAFAFAASLFPGAAGWLQYDRLAIANGELWRLVTAHFVHWSGEHLFWDALALGVLGWMCERENARRFLQCGAAAAVAIPVALWFTEPAMATYRGLSGIDSALFVLLAAGVIREAIVERDWTRFGVALVVVFGFTAKVGFEFLTGATLFVDSPAAAMTPIPSAHVVGGLIGLLFGSVPHRARSGITMQCRRRHPER